MIISRVRSRIPPPSVMRYPPAGRDRRANAEELPQSPDMGRRPRLTFLAYRAGSSRPSAADSHSSASTGERPPGARTGIPHYLRGGAFILLGVWGQKTPYEREGMDSPQDLKIASFKTMAIAMDGVSATETPRQSGGR